MLSRTPTGFAGACVLAALLALTLAGCSQRGGSAGAPGSAAATSHASSVGVVAGVDLFDSPRRVALLSFIASREVTTVVSAGPFDAPETLVGHDVLRGQLADSASAAGFGSRDLAWLVWRQDGWLHGQLLGYEPTKARWIVFEKPVPFEAVK